MKLYPLVVLGLIIMKKMHEDGKMTLFWGDVFDCIKELPKNEIQAVITSPTYWGKRQFTNDKNEFGSEKLEEYVNRNVRLFSELLTLMKDGGSIFVVIQDTYMGSGVSRSHHNHWENNKDPSYRRAGLDSERQGNKSAVTAHHSVIKNKSLCGIPYRIALKLVDMGFIWRQQIIWEKPNPMPENIEDRVRQSAEYILHFTNKGKYKFNPEAIMINGHSGKPRLPNQVWTASTEPKENHTATFPSKVVEKLLLSVTDKNDTVFEPFLGSGTTAVACKQLNRKFIGFEKELEYCKIAEKRLEQSNLENFK